MAAYYKDNVGRHTVTARFDANINGWINGKNSNINDNLNHWLTRHYQDNTKYVNNNKFQSSLKSYLSSVQPQPRPGSGLVIGTNAGDIIDLEKYC